MKKIIFLLPVISLVLLTGGCEKEVFIEPKVGSQVAYTRIFVNSKPEGAAIYIDGKTSGLITPDTVKWLGEGEYRLTLKKKYFWDTTLTITAVNNQTTNAYVDYYKSERMLGSIRCASTPSGAAIYLDNVNTGLVTPAIITKLIPKEYYVKLEYPEYRKDSINVVVESTSLVDCGMTLEDTLDVVTYTKANSQLPSNNFTCVTEDKDGNMWFGTLGDGLLKYDGKKYVTYNHVKNSFILSDFINYLKTGPDGNLWVAFSTAVSKYDGVNWEPSVTTSWINSLNVSANGTMLAAADRGAGIVKYSNGKYDYLTQEKGDIPDNFVYTAFCDTENNIWIGSKNGGINYNSGGVWVHLDSEKNALPYHLVRRLDLVGNTMVGLFFYISDLLSGTATYSLARYESGKWVSFLNSNGQIEDVKMNVDAKNRIWFGCKNTQIQRVNSDNTKNSITSIISKNIRKYQNNKQTIKNEYLTGTSAYVDSKRNLWILSPGTCILKVKPGRWSD